MSDAIERIPPQSIEAEQSLLGSLLIDKEAINKIADIVIVEDFYKEIHAYIFDAILDLYARHDPIDLLSLGNKLEERGQLTLIGGRSYLINLTNQVPTSSNIVYYAQIIQKKSLLRRLQQAAIEIDRLSYQPDTEIQNILDEAEQRIFGVSEKLLKKNFVPLRDILNDAFDRIDELHKEKGKLRGVSSGFHEIDNLLAGFQKSDLVILAARPSVGKTSFALDIARQAATKSQTPVAIFSLEMSKEQLVDRMICSEASVDLWKMRTGKLTDTGDTSDFVRIGHAIDSLSQAPLYIDDTAAANIMEIRAKSRRLQAEKGLGMIILDYLQLMEGHHKTEGRVQEIAEITRGLKSIARELNVPILALSQLSRSVELSKPAIPKLSHLRESGSIEQDADIVMFIYRKAADRNYRLDELTPEERNSAEIHVAKHRNGPTGVVNLFFDAQRASFKNLERRMDGVGAPGAANFDIFESATPF